MRPFHEIDVMNTVGEWVDAFNENALASSDHTWYLGEMLFNGMLYTGLETIGGVEIKSLSNLNISAMSPQNIELDNFYLYFRDINKILLFDQVTFDLRPYMDGHPHFFYVNSELGFRISQEFKQHDDEIMLFRFAISPKEIFTQCFVTAQRFGSNVYDSANEFYLVSGCMPTPVANDLRIKLGDGTIKRSGVKFDYHQAPDVHHIEDKPLPFRIRYITKENKVDYTQDTVNEVDPTRMLNYTTHELTKVPDNKFTVQRVLYDLYMDCLIIQYGDMAFDTMRDALTNVNNVSYNFPYDGLLYIPLGLIFIKQNATDLSDTEQCVMVQQLNTTIAPGDSAFFAEDNYARGRIKILQDEVADLQRRVKQLEIDLAAHKADKNNPHEVTKAQVGLGKVENLSPEELYDVIINNGIDYDKDGNFTGADDKDAAINRFVRKDTFNETSNYGCLFNRGYNSGYPSASEHKYDFGTELPFIIVNKRRLYLGCKPANAPEGSFAIALENQ